MKWFDIESGHNPGHVYLRRLRIIQCPLFGIYLHQIYEPDTQAGRDITMPHDHPYSFLALILVGGYQEQAWETHKGLRGRALVKSSRRLRTHRPGHVNTVGMGMAHFITKLFRIPTWTLVLRGPGRKARVVGYEGKQALWGFYDQQGRFIFWKTYNASVQRNEG